MIPASVNEQLRQYGQWRYSGHVLALVDGIQYQQHTGQQLTAETDRAVSLFAGTHEMALAHAGPWLLDPKMARDFIADLRELEQARPGVIWLSTSESLERQAEKLRPHLHTRIPKGRPALLRFWDPRVLHALDAVCRGKSGRELFRAADTWHYLNEGRRFTIDDNGIYRRTMALLKVYEDRNYVDFIRGHIVLDYPALANDPTLRDRLDGAFAQTRMLRFTHDGPIVDFLYVEATTPGFYWIPEVIAWLHKPGVAAEQRFEMLMQATRKRQQEMKEKR
ncbi:DUF4123 domain-containing protein [Paraburkholderia sp. JPY419]|uniref:DUF4123 domain-containing protein n=1 Tax=Paraburkholderia sp. JPY419 TaxID=667660 RepID=UPI003D2034CA